MMARWAVVCVLLLLGMPAAAQDTTTGPASGAPAADEWKFTFSPYAWGTAMSGKISAGDLSATMDVPFSDILDDLNFAFMGTGTAQRGNLILAVDSLGSWLHVKEKVGPATVGFGPTTAQQGLLTINVPAVTTSVGALDISLRTTMIMVDAAVGWRLLTRHASILAGHPEPAQGDTRKLTLDVFASARYWYFKNEVEVSSPPTVIPGFTLQPSTPFPAINLPGIQVPGTTLAGVNAKDTSSTWWIDPVIGIRTHVDATERLGFTVLADVGGFDLGSASKVTWQLMGLASWKISDSWSMVVAYRSLAFEREKSDAQGDLRLHGPLIGATYHF